jgi:hypothetical protein
VGEHENHQKAGGSTPSMEPRTYKTKHHVQLILSTGTDTTQNKPMQSNLFNDNIIFTKTIIVKCPRKAGRTTVLQKHIIKKHAKSVAVKLKISSLQIMGN